MKLSRERIEEFGEKIDKRLGGRVERIILFGSYARDENLPGSDVDLLIVLKEKKESDQSMVADIAGDYFLNYGITLSPKIIEEKELEKKKDYTFFREIMDEGVKVYG